MISSQRMTSRRSMVAFVAFSLWIPGSLRAQQLTVSDVESQVRASLTVWNTGDAERIINTPGPGGNFEAYGFGYRTKDSRAEMSRDEELAIIRDFLSSAEYYRVTVDELDVAVDGDIGIAWGFFTEEFRLPGRQAEVVQVRFTTALTRNESGWRQILFHRDAQPFDDEGSYIPVSVASN